MKLWKEKKKLPFYWPFFYKKHLDMANEKYLMTIGMEKWRKFTSQIFDFWNFITEIFAKHVERFSKIMKLWRISKIIHFLVHFSTRYGGIWHTKNISWQSAWKIEENVHLRLLKLYHRDICKTCWEIFKNYEFWWKSGAKYLPQKCVLRQKIICCDYRHGLNFFRGHFYFFLNHFF